MQKVPNTQKYTKLTKYAKLTNYTKSTKHTEHIKRAKLTKRKTDSEYQKIHIVQESERNACLCVCIGLLYVCV